MKVYSDKSGNGMGVGIQKEALVQGQLAAVGMSDPIRVKGVFNVAVTGEFEATYQVVRSFDNGLTYHPLTALGGAFSFSAPAQEMFDEPERVALYAIECTAYDSGVIVYRISQ